MAQENLPVEPPKGIPPSRFARDQLVLPDVPHTRLRECQCEKCVVERMQIKD